VTDDLRDRTPAGVEVDRLLLDAKLSVPQPRRGSVSRAGLIEAAGTSGCRVVGITAPAGYGKSTLLSQWALAEDRRVAWVSLNGFDDDPAGLLMLLASAYARVSPGNEDLDRPVLVVNGDDDTMLPTISSFHLAQLRPDAELSIYPNSGHGLFVAQALDFLRD
jgi:pimeloyl-ACP methyl ester carboxylesterase